MIMIGFPTKNWRFTHIFAIKKRPTGWSLQHGRKQSGQRQGGGGSTGEAFSRSTWMVEVAPPKGTCFTSAFVRRHREGMMMFFQALPSPELT